MKTIGTGDTKIDRDGVIALREEIIALRDGALAQGHMEWAVALSHVIAYMINSADAIWPEVNADGETVKDGGPVKHALVSASVAKINRDLKWQGPTGKKMAIVALPREMAEALLTFVEDRK